MGQYCGKCGQRLAHDCEERFVSGLYQIYWTADSGGGSSLAAVGQFPSGRYWIAPTNWVNGSVSLESQRDKIERFELIKMDVDD